MCIVRVNYPEEAINFIKRNLWDDGFGIFTESDRSARKFQSEIDAGHIGLTYLLLYLYLCSDSLVIQTHSEEISTSMERRECSSILSGRL
jgi:hypothetical protein